MNENMFSYLGRDIVFCGFNNDKFVFHFNGYVHFVESIKEIQELMSRELPTNPSPVEEE